jgi:hypothetical protein
MADDIARLATRIGDMVDHRNRPAGLQRLEDGLQEGGWLHVKMDPLIVVVGVVIIEVDHREIEGAGRQGESRGGRHDDPDI